MRITQHDPGPSRTSKSDGLGDSFTSREPERRRGKRAFMCLSDSQAPCRPRVSSMAEVGVVETSPPARRCAKVGIRGGSGPRRASRTAACHSEDPLYKTSVPMERSIHERPRLRRRGRCSYADIPAPRPTVCLGSVPAAVVGVPRVGATSKGSDASQASQAGK